MQVRQMRVAVSKDAQMFRLVAKLWIIKARLGLSSPISAREPTGSRGAVMPVVRDLPDISASLAARIAL